MRQSLLAFLLLFFLPFQVFAYEVPERDYWRAFTLSLINANRAEHGLNPVGIDAQMNELSQPHANDSATHYEDATAASRRATYLVHVSSDGRTFADRVRDQGITAGAKFGENVGLRFSSGFGDVHKAVEEAIRYMHDYMMAEVPPDDGHRVTILTPEYTHVGVGLEFHKKAGEAPNTLFLVTDFAKFTDGREVVIPKLGKRPEWIPREPLVTTPPQASPFARRVRARAVDRLRRRTINTVTPPAKEPSSILPTLRGRVELRRMERVRRLQGNGE